jgi:hypothetical protein
VVGVQVVGGQGPETVDVMVRKMAGHDLVHLDQLTRTVGAYVRLTGGELFGCPVTCTG